MSTQHLCFATSTNSKGKRDGDYFVSEAESYAKFYNGLGHTVSVHKVPAGKTTYAARKKLVLSVVKNNPLATRFSFFCHGSAKWLYGAGLSIWNVVELVNAINETDVKIALYACKNARWLDLSTPLGDRVKGDFDLNSGEMRGEYGFAMRMAYYMALAPKKFSIFGHTTRGDTTHNPYCQLITRNGELIKREWIAEPVPFWKRLSQPEAYKSWIDWKNSLWKDENLRFIVPFRG